jgi:hypothetical protein
VDTFDVSGRTGTFDTGFMNIGLRPTGEELGIGAFDALGKPLSVAATTGATNLAVAGSVKAPGLRNVSLTAPYFRNGSQLTLAQVVDFYNRGGDVATAEQHPLVRPLGLTAQEKADLVSFLEALADPRVAIRSAPFDGPQLFVPDGHRTAGAGVATDPAGRALDAWAVVAATGAGGGTPLPLFPSPLPAGTPPELPTGPTSGGGSGGSEDPLTDGGRTGGRPALDLMPPRVTLTFTAAARRAAPRTGRLALAVRCDEACAVRVQLVLTRAQAAALGLRTSRPTLVVGTGSARLARAGRRAMAVRATRAAAARFRAARRVTVVVRVTATDRAGLKRVVSRRVALG